jgi:hypothetical protein
LTVASLQARLSASALRSAINYGRLHPIRLDGRTNLIACEEVERYRREHLGQCGKRKQSDATLTEQQRKQRAYQQA